MAGLSEGMEARYVLPICSRGRASFGGQGAHKGEDKGERFAVDVGLCVVRGRTDDILRNLAHHSFPFYLLSPSLMRGSFGWFSLQVS